MATQKESLAKTDSKLAEEAMTKVSPPLRGPWVEGYMSALESYFFTGNLKKYAEAAYERKYLRD